MILWLQVGIFPGGHLIEHGCLFEEIQYLVPPPPPSPSLPLPPPPSPSLPSISLHLCILAILVTTCRCSVLLQRKIELKGLQFILSNAFLLNHEIILCVLLRQCLFDPNKEKNEDLDLSVFNPLSQEEAVSTIV